MSTTFTCSATTSPSPAPPLSFYGPRGKIETGGDQKRSYSEGDLTIHYPRFHGLTDASTARSVLNDPRAFTDIFEKPNHPQTLSPSVENKASLYSPDSPVPPFVIKAFGDHYPALRSIFTEVAVQEYQLDEWRQLQVWYADCDDPEFRRFQFEYFPTLRKLITMVPTPAHDSANIGTHEGADKYPDLVSGFQVDGVKYLWDVLETAKSQGLYTHFGGETINKEGVMNKISSAILEYTLKADSIAKRRAVAPIVSIDCFRVEEVPPIGFGSKQWSYSVRPKKDHPFVLDSIKLDTPAFEALHALKKSLFPGTGRVRGSRENLTPGPGKLRATTEDLIPDAGPFYGATASGRPRYDNKAIDLVVRADYPPDYMPKVEKFLNMVAEDFKKKLRLLIKHLDNIDLVVVIAQRHHKRGRSMQEGERCVEELRAYIAKLRQVEEQDSLSQHFPPLIDTLVSHLQQGAKDTASRRLYAHSTLQDDQTLYKQVETASDTLSSESGKWKVTDTLATFWVDTKKAREGSPSSQEQAGPLDERGERNSAERHHAGDQRVEHRGAFKQGNTLQDEQEHNLDHGEHVERAERSGSDKRVGSRPNGGRAGSSGSGVRGGPDSSSRGQHHDASNNANTGSGASSSRSCSGVGASSAGKRGGGRGDALGDHKHSRA
ncbi:hypothetical protein FOMPIDRAFT_1049548 [Fomitopsis schrenkii]|uniref:Uncharacterized protein n=1 Tax=Fomitopsis schrenkii TaxID=2126942 RepID=S8EB67_FOMSC|nr:hypothetical protein FOMPIDRAFT_1049548 [Fomitopsis schrenkii]